MKNILIGVSMRDLRRVALWAVLGIVCFSSGPALAQRLSDFYVPDPGPGVCVQNCGNNSNSHTPSSPPDPGANSRREWAERIDKANAFNDAGLSAWNRGEWGVAAEQFQQAYAWNPKSKKIFNNLINAKRKDGLAAMERGDWGHAASRFQSLLYHQPDSQEFQRLAAAAAEKQQSVRRAYDLQRQDNRQWEQAHAQYKQGLLSAEKGDWASAESYFRSASQTYPAEPAYLKNVAWAKTKQGDQARNKGDAATALAFWKSALETDPENAYARKNVPLVEKYLIEEQANKTAAAHITQETRKLSETFASTPASDGLDYGDLKITISQAGTPKRGGRVTDPGAELLSVEHHSRNAKLQPNDSGREIARQGFDIPGEYRGTLVHPDKHSQQRPLSALDRQIPAGAKEDPQIKQMQAWYHTLEVQKAEKEQKIAEFKEQQKTSKDPSLATNIAALSNDVKRLNDDQGQATKTVKKRVEVIKKQMLDKGLAWDESPLPDPTEVVNESGAVSSDKAEQKEPVRKSK